MSPGGNVRYVGFENVGAPFNIRWGEVTGKGSAYLRGKSRVRKSDTTVNAIHIESRDVMTKPPGNVPVEAAPGFSGGPVFNENGEAIAVVAGGWLKKFLAVCAYRFVNLAVSVEPLTKALASI